MSQSETISAAQALLSRSVPSMCPVWQKPYQIRDAMRNKSGCIGEFWLHRQIEEAFLIS